MKTSIDGIPGDAERDDGWDEEVLVWNATVARIPAPAVQQDAARGPGGRDAKGLAARRRLQGKDNHLAPGRSLMKRLLIGGAALVAVVLVIVVATVVGGGGGGGSFGY